MEDLKLICALATWRTLRKKQKSQYDVIAAFCKSIIKKYGYRDFKANDIVDKLKVEYGFKIFNSIINKVLCENLQNYLQYDEKSNCFNLKPSVDIDENISDFTSYIQQYIDFSKEIVEFVLAKTKQHKIKKHLTDDIVIQVFNTFMLDKQYAEENKFLFPYFTEFLNDNKEKYEKILQTIKEGLILYEGLKYNTYDIKRIKNYPQIMLFLDTEILFDAVGYNEQIYKRKFEDFYSLVCRYDIDEVRLRMPLFYTEDIEQEIKAFFSRAKEKKENPIDKSTAMRHLMQKCKNIDELESEEIWFFHTLEKTFQIKKYTKQSYENLLNTKKIFNLESKQNNELIKKDIQNKKNIEDEEIENAIKTLSFINMLRGKKSTKFIDSAVLFITGTKLVNEIARHEIIKQETIMPLSGTLDFMITRLWDLLETSLGQSITLESLNPIFNIQAALQDMLADNIINQHERAKQNFKDNGDKELYEKEILDIKEKMNLNINNRQDLEDIEILFSFGGLEEYQKLNNIREHRKYEEGRQEEREEKNKEIKKLAKELEIQKNKIKELKRKDRVRCIKYYFIIIKRKIKKYGVDIFRKMKKYYKFIRSKPIKFALGLIGFIASCLTIYSCVKGF